MTLILSSLAGVKDVPCYQGHVHQFYHIKKLKSCRATYFTQLSGYYTKVHFMWAIINALRDNYTHTHTHTHTHTCIHACMHACTHMHNDLQDKRNLYKTWRTWCNNTLSKHSCMPAFCR